MTAFNRERTELLSLDFFFVKASNGTNSDDTSGEIFDSIRYIPMIDENRHLQLMKILPSYLLEEIDFSPATASMFFLQLLNVLVKNIP